ncbi:hypothetical protein HPG69_013464 [Diceros bicornis minor]|uniref:non-specific serine/threonine protein kinase n=1 Tax=Diceros bicornis minor TaxID=77932 RepID=A0A7J7EA94_DICBM|nr:hypothetical protein HPG69_013464 [Diceros bicornis minor]
MAILILLISIVSSKSNMLQRPFALSVEEEIHFGHCRLLKTITKGTFAKVKLAWHILTRKEVAVKIIKKTQQNSFSLQRLSCEVQIIKLLSHFDIVKLFEVMETKKTPFLLMEYTSGREVFKNLPAYGSMKEKEVRCKFHQMESAANCIVHRDLKVEHLLLDTNVNIKIVHLGFSSDLVFDSKWGTFYSSLSYGVWEHRQGGKSEGPLNFKELLEWVLSGIYNVSFYMSMECEYLFKKFLIIKAAQEAL